MKMKNKTWTGNNIGAEEAKMISEALKDNSTLTTLDLSGDEKQYIKIRRNKKWKW